MVTRDDLGETCGNKCAGVRGSPRVFAVIVTQLITQRWECLDTNTHWVPALLSRISADEIYRVARPKVQF